MPAGHQLGRHSAAATKNHDEYMSDHTPSHGVLELSTDNKPAVFSCLLLFLLLLLLLLGSIAYDM